VSQLQNAYPWIKVAAVASKPKLHHYVPQFYLRQWCDADGKLVVYPVDGGKPFRTNPKNVAAECGLYTPIPGVEDVRHDHEQWFAGWEGIYSNKWPDIFDRAENPDTRHNLARFLATLLLRHPTSREIVCAINRRLLAMASNAQNHERVSILRHQVSVRVSAAEILEFASTDPDAVRTDWLRQMPTLAPSLADLLFSRRWGVIFARAPAFITSDNPVFLDRGCYKGEKFGMGTPGTLISFPISPTRFLLIADEWQHPFMHYRLEDAQVFMRRVVRKAHRFVFSSHESAELVDIISSIRQETKNRSANGTSTAPD